MKVLFISAYELGRPNTFIQSQSDSLKKAGIDLNNFYIKKRGLAGNLVNYFRLLFFIKQNPGFNIIHAHYGYTALLTYLTFPRSKLVISFMGTDLMGILDENFKQSRKGLFNKYLSKFLQSKADFIIVKSKGMLDMLDRKYFKITAVIPNGIDFEKFPVVDKEFAKRKLGIAQTGKKKILFLGNPNQRIKNYKLVHEAFNVLQDKNVEIICPYPVKGEEVHLYLNACDVLAFASLQEGSPNLIKEALCCNCPIVSTDVGDVSERIANVSGCYIADYSPIAFATELRTALRFANRTNGRISVENLKTDEIALQLIKVYKSLLSIGEDSKAD